MKINHLYLGPLVAIAVFVSMLSGGIDYLPSITAAITLLTAWWWATEPLPIPATSLIPFAAFPLFGVLDHKQSAAGLGSHVILLLLGGFIMAKGLEKTGAHQRFAMLILRTVGNAGNKQLVLAYMVAAAFLSMWVSNTATCLMLMPIALASLAQLNNPRMTIPLILSVAYACSIGGIATLIGTPPNVIFAGIYEEVLGKEFGFLAWLKIGLPVVALILPVAWLWLTRNVSGTCCVELPPRQSWTVDQKRVVAVFGLIVSLWIFRTEPFGGWAGILGADGVGDSSIALLGAALMFVVRSRNGGGLLDWATAVTIPWGVLLMFGAGITIAGAFFESGLADLIGVFLSGVIGGLPVYLLIVLICVIITFMTELNSNVATTTLVIPILAAASAATDLPAELLMIPATISASCAFMLPVATAPNAIAYATGKIAVRQMLREGFGLNLILAFFVSGTCYLILT
ncbi:MAG: SLC13/DASS family transporter [Gammaproteobacteria bacterium]|nr:SLC13/DASS family transporter [Gammaproteobacteria bacterium]